VLQSGDQTGILNDGFSYSRPVVLSVASWDTCDTSICGSLSLVGLQTSNPSEGPYPSDPKVSRLLVVTGENLGVSNIMQSVSVATVRSAISPTGVSIGSAACSEVVVSAAGTVLTCLAPAPRGPNSIYGSVGCQALKLVVNVRNQTSAPSSRSSLTYLENMPSVIPTAGSNVRGYVWMDGDGAGMTFQFGIQAGTKGDVWGPVRTNQGRQYLNRPGARSDDFAYICYPSPAPGGDTTCGKYLVSKVSTDLWSLIGADASCTWPSDSVLHVRFGFGATIVPSLQPPAIIKIRPGVIMTFGAPSYAVDIDILVVSPTTLRYPPDEKSAKVDGLPSVRAVPPHVILQSPAYIGPCDDLLVVAVVDYASGSRDTGLSYVWSSVPDLTPIRRTPTTGPAASSARVAWDDRELDYGVTYVVSVSVTNFLGQQGSASITVVREQIGVPTVMIPGGMIRKIRRDRMVVVNAAAALPACLGTGCTCVKSSGASSNTAGWGGSPATLEFQWAVPVYNLASAELHDAAALGTNSVLVIPASAVKMLAVGANYTLKVEAGVWTGFAQNDIYFYSTVAEVVLMPYSVPPVVRIRYGNRECSKVNPLLLDGSASFDPDSLGQQLKFEWYLDAGAMYDRLPLHQKEQRGLMSPGVVTRKSYINIVQSASSTLSRMILKTNNARSTILQTNAASLQESSPIIPDTDFELFAWGSALPSPKPAIPWPVLVVIGLYVTDGDDVVSYNSVELSFYDPLSVAQEAQSLGVLSSATFPISIEPLLDSVPIAENDLVLRVRLDDETIKKASVDPTFVVPTYIWSCDHGSSQVPLLGRASLVGVLEMAGGTWASGQAFTCSLSASWPNGQTQSAWLPIRTATAPFGGSLTLSSTGNIAMISEWSIQCRLWTAADKENLPLFYSFLADLGGAVGEIVLREPSPKQSLTGFVLPSSRTLLWNPDLNGGQGAWYLCRIECPLTVTAVIFDTAGASRRVSAVSNITRPHCSNALQPCDANKFLGLINNALGAVDVGGPDPEQTNYQLLIVSLELSDIQTFSLNVSDPDATRPPPTGNPILGTSSLRTAPNYRDHLGAGTAVARRAGRPLSVPDTAKIDLTEEETNLLAAAVIDDLAGSISEAEGVDLTMESSTEQGNG